VRLGAVLRARTLVDPHGFMKAPIDGTSEQILGFSAEVKEALKERVS
jgi:hypothetical protein